MINVIINGCTGKMGQVISLLIEKDPDMQVVAGFASSGTQLNSYPVFSMPRDCTEKCDVIIDFSVPDALGPLSEYAVEEKIPLVIATTGLSNTDLDLINKAAKVIPIFRAANMSLGINLVTELIAKASQVLADNFDIEIVEKHHNQKIDAPSGTALMFADTINSVLDNKAEYVYDRHSKREKRKTSEIGIHSIRGGTIVGEHSVIFAGTDESIEIKHSAMSRNAFGMGALKAAKFILSKQPNLYDMKDLILNM